MGKQKQAKPPKTKCCVSSTKCGRCPLRMLKEGTLPEGYTVKKRRLMTYAADGSLVPVAKKGKSSQHPAPVTVLSTGAARPKKAKKKRARRLDRAA